VSSGSGPESGHSNVAGGDEAAAVDKVLRGPVLDILIENIPALRKIERSRAYARILNDPELADTCFAVFRSKTGAFRAILVGPDGQPVKDDNGELSCGRSLAQVIAVIVRSVAKRYFNAYFEPKHRAAPAPPRPGFLESILKFGAAAPPPPPERRKAPRNPRAEELFSTLDAFLLFEWQLLLIPHYAPISISMLRGLGPRILNFRDPAQLDILAKAGAEANALIKRVDRENANKAWADIVGPDSGHTAGAERWDFIIARLDLDE
jgi:hypothetical protein